MFHGSREGQWGTGGETGGAGGRKVGRAGFIGLQEDCILYTMQ